MNEWPSKEFYSGSLVTDQPPPVYRQYWEDNWNQGRINTNIKNTMNNFKINNREYQQQSIMAPQNFINEDVGIPPCVSSKKKKNGISDPRFKRVINPDVRSNICSDMRAGKVINVTSTQQVLNDRMNEEKILTDKVISFLKVPNTTEPSIYSSPSAKKFTNEAEETVRDISEMVTKDVGFELPPAKCCLPNPNDDFIQSNAVDFTGIPNFECFGDLDKIKNNSNSNMKRSASDCTMHTKKSRGDENEEESLQKAKLFPSATRLNKVQNWMKDYKVPAEKRRSVITVIGQTQNKPFSKILNEINQRRKLAKELDKHALCKAIMETTENQMDVKNLIAKVDFVLPDGKIIYSTEKVYLRKENSKFHIGKESEECVQTSLDKAELNEKFRKRCEMIPERDSSISQVGKKNKVKRSGKKLAVPVKEKIPLNDNLKSYSLRGYALLFWPFLALLCLMLCAYAYYYKYKCSYSSFLSDFFRPKNRACCVCKRKKAGKKDKKKITKRKKRNI